MLNWIQRFFRAKGKLRWKVYYAFDFDKDLEKRWFYLTSTTPAGKFIRVTSYGNAHPQTEDEKSL